MTAEVHHIPLDHIATDALTRDRTGTDLEPLLELRASILASGVRMPIEVFHLAEPQGELAYGLISGFRRLAAVRSLRDDVFDGSRFTDIPAFIREPADLTEAMTAMVEENAIRAEVSAWEQALVAVIACERGTFDTVDAAMDTLYRNLHRNKRRTIRMIAHVVGELDGLLTTPETWPAHRLMRIAAAISRGYGDLIAHALTEAESREPETQWRILQSILAEAENHDIPAPSRDAKGVERPRRTWRAPVRRIRVRRELTPDGWCLHFTGPDADGGLIDLVFFHTEQLLSPKG
jgi:ParB family chromosome partitioning protein